MFDEDLASSTIDAGRGARSPERRGHRGPPGPEEVYRAFVLGLGDYVRKNGFREVVLGHVRGHRFGARRHARRRRPGPGGGPHARDALPVLVARERRGRRGVRAPPGRPDRHLPIDEVFDAYRRTLADLFAGTEEDVAEENLQARIRGNLLMALSNKFGSMVLATGNKSEYAVGYATLYGDMAGGSRPSRTCRRRSSTRSARGGTSAPRRPPIPDRSWPSRRARSSVRPAGHRLAAALRPARSDHRGLRRGGPGVDAIVARGFDRATVERVVRMIDRAEYKRRQAAPGVKITPKAFGRDRRLPITNRYGPT